MTQLGRLGATFGSKGIIPDSQEIKPSFSFSCKCRWSDEAVQSFRLGAQDPYWVAPFGIYCSLFRCSLDTFFSGNALQLRLFFGLSQKKNAFSIRAGCASM